MRKAGFSQGPQDPAPPSSGYSKEQPAGLIRFDREIETNTYVLKLNAVIKLSGVCNHFGCHRVKGTGNTILRTGNAQLTSFSPAVE